jgi:uncharacterized membrane protein YgcG
VGASLEVEVVLVEAEHPGAGDMTSIKRVLKHLFYGRLYLAKRFPVSSKAAITEAIARSEARHMGELSFVVEPDLDWHDLFRGVTPRQRAVEVFSRLHIWDTEHNSGVLIYLLLADSCVEIVADRGIHACVGDAQWKAICSEMESSFREGMFEQGVLAGIARISDLLEKHFPAQGTNPNELPNEPVLL